MNVSYLLRQGKVELGTAAVPTIKDDEVLVQVAAVGACGSDVHYYQHGKIGPYVVEHPLVLGHELSGRITAVGAAVPSDRIGQRVAVEPQRPAGYVRSARRAVITCDPA